MCRDDKKALFVKFNTAYYLPFSDYPDLLELKKQKKPKNIKNKNKKNPEVQNICKTYLTDRKCAEFKEHISKIIKSKLVDYLISCNYYSCLSDESTDPSVTEEEVIFI